jgi:hypothetical protein
VYDQLSSVVSPVILPMRPMAGSRVYWLSISQTPAAFTAQTRFSQRRVGIPK